MQNEVAYFFARVGRILRISSVSKRAFVFFCQSNFYAVRVMILILNVTIRFCNGWLYWKGGFIFIQE